MTKKERIYALLKGKKIDRVPLFPFLLGFCARNLGWPIRTIYEDAEKSFYAQLCTHNQYDFDWGPLYGYASYGTWEFGGEVQMPENIYEQAPLHKRFPVQREEDVRSVLLPKIEIAGSLPIAMSFAKFQEKYEVPITFIIGGPFTIAGNICSPEKLCRWMIRRNELVQLLMKMSVEHICDAVRYWADTFGAEKVIPFIWEPLASNDILSSTLFEKIVFPYLLQLGENILHIGVKHIFYHICGEQNNNLSYWAQVPSGDPGLYSVGSQIDIEFAIELFGDKGIIAGNIEPNLIQTSEPQQVYHLSAQIIEKGKTAPRGFMLMSGCEVPPDAPPYNIYMMKKAIEDYGGY